MSWKYSTSIFITYSELQPIFSQTVFVYVKLDKVKQESRSKDENFQYLEDKFKAKDQICRSQQEKLKEIGSQLESKTELCKQMEKQILQLSQGMQGKEEICSSLKQQVVLQEAKKIFFGKW